MAFTRTGDANLDGLVNEDDVTIVGATYAPGVAQVAWALGDFDYNGFVDDDDVTLLGAFYDRAAVALITPAPSDASNAVAAVSEPESFWLIILGFAVIGLFRGGNVSCGRYLVCLAGRAISGRQECLPHVVPRVPMHSCCEFCRPELASIGRRCPPDTRSYIRSLSGPRDSTRGILP